jgi:hypothetical protein
MLRRTTGQIGDNDVRIGSLDVGSLDIGHFDH